MQTSSRKVLIVLAGLILAGFVVYQSFGFIHKADFSGEKLLHAVAGAKVSLLLLSVVVIYVCYAFRALRWQLFQGNLGSSRFWIIYKMTLAGFEAIRNTGELLLAVLYSGVHWFLVLLVYYWGSRSFGGRLGTLSLGEVMLVMAFSLVGSVVQLPAVGGGAQLASALVFTKILGVETEPATAAAIVIWLIGFAACCFAGVPLLIQEGLWLGKLRELAQEKDREGEAARQGDPAS